MEFKLLILLLFALCAQNAAGSKKRKKGGSRILKVAGLGTVLLTNKALNSQTPQTHALCPATLPPYSQSMMQYIYCGDKEQTADFFEKYLTNENDDESCSKIQSLFQKVKTLGFCATKKFTNIVSGATKRILGKTLGPKTELGMFKDFLMDISGVGDDFQALSKKFETLKKPDFFRIKTALIFIQYQNLNNLEALKEAMEPKYETMNFDKVIRMIPYAQKIMAYKMDQIKMAVDPKYQVLDFDELDAARKQFAEYGFDNVYENCVLSINCLLQLGKAENQNLNWNKVIRVIPYAQMIEPYDDQMRQIEMAVDPKYQKVDFSKDDHVHDLLHLRFTDLGGLAKPESEYLNWNQVLSILFINKRMISDDSERIRMAVEPKYQKWDFEKVGFIYDLLKKLAPYHDKTVHEEIITLALAPWVQGKEFEIEQAKQIFKQCVYVMDSEELNCWKLRTKKFKKTDL